MNETAIVGENVEIIQTGGGSANRSALSWGVAIAGALTATAVSFIFLSLGSGIGLSVASPYSGPSVTTMTVAGAIWLVLAQTFGFATGGYLAGRLRIRTHIPGPETKFRDAAHGFMAWVIGVSLTAVMIVMAGLFTASTAANVVGSVGSGAMQGAGAAMGQAAGGQDSSAYFVDTLFRTNPSGSQGAARSAPAGGAATSGGTAANLSTQTPASATGQTAASPSGETPPSMAATSTNQGQGQGTTGSGQTGTGGNDAQRGEVSRIFSSSVREGRISDADRTYAARVIAARTGIPAEEAERRVTEVQDQAVAAAKQAAETARKAGAYLSFWSFMALLFGAVAATLGGILGGELRDEV